MREIFFLLGALVLLTVLKPVMRLVLAHVLGRAIGRAALAKTPDRIHLRPATADAWRDRRAADAAARPLLADGFEDAGTFTADETPGLAMRLFVREEDALRAAVYEHPRVGLWTEIFLRYVDGTSATFTTASDPGLAPRPGHLMVRDVGVPVERVLARAVAQRPRGATRPARVESVAREFEDDYAESMAWRKRTGVSTREVVAVARKRQGQTVG